MTDQAINGLATALLDGEGLRHTFWGGRIALAEATGHFSDDDLRRAGHWPTCACGEQSPDIPRTNLGDPLDDRLHELGLRFDRNVQSHAMLGAAETLIAIEKRAAEILSDKVIGIIDGALLANAMAGGES